MGYLFAKKIAEECLGAEPPVHGASHRQLSAGSGGREHTGLAAAAALGLTKRTGGPLETNIKKM